MRYSMLRGVIMCLGTLVSICMPCFIKRDRRQGNNRIRCRDWLGHQEDYVLAEHLKTQPHMKGLTCGSEEVEWFSGLSWAGVWPEEMRPLWTHIASTHPAGGIKAQTDHRLGNSRPSALCETFLCGLAWVSGDCSRCHLTYSPRPFPLPEGGSAWQRR